MNHSTSSCAISRFLTTDDFRDSDFAALRDVFDHLYSVVWRGKPHPSHAKDPANIKTHWSREWEYPWAVTHAEVTAQHTILDCGCGGSPLLLYFVRVYGRAGATRCRAVGIDKTHGDEIAEDQEALLNDSDRHLITLQHYHINPRRLVGPNIKIRRDDMSNIPYPDAFFDRVFCVSVLQHLEEGVARKSIGEMVRVLKPGGRLLITLDHEGEHVKPWCRGRFREITNWAGLPLYGPCDFTIPPPEKAHGSHNVVGLAFRKPSHAP